MEPPSEQLSEGLLGLKICRPRDFRTCRSRVRRLARDLPCFDSVWIDALLQARKLTPFQAKQLATGDASRLRVGPCVLTEKLGSGRNAATYLARPRDGTERCVLKLIDRPAESVDTVLGHLRRLQSSLKGIAHPSLVAPRACLEHEGRLVTVSRYVPGPHLGELLVRRGRFPAEIVTEIARQLVDVLAAYAAAGGVHGDIVIRNVRLTSAGVTVLVDAGIAPAVSPQLTIDHSVSPERYETIAPELIGTGDHATFASDIYALGCLLWQLLAGRPPFATGDPLGKLAAHRTRVIPDVRQWAPDTPHLLAEAIRGFTSRNPDERVRAFDKARQSWRSPRRAGRRRLARFQSAFRVAVPTTTVSRTSSSVASRSALLVLLVFTSGAALTLFDLGATGSLLELAPPLSRLVNRTTGLSPEDPRQDEDRVQSESTAAEPNDAHGKLRPLPAPDARGVIELKHPGPYSAVDMAHVGSLTIKGDTHPPPVIVVADRPLQLAARRLTLQNLQVRSSQNDGSDRDPQSRPPSALLLVRAQDVVIERCRFETGSLNASPKSGRPAPSQENRPVALGWKLVDAGDRSGGQIQIVNSIFVGPGPALYCSDAPHDVRMVNCLKIGGSALTSLAAAPRLGRTLHMHFERVTLRSTQSLLRIQQASGESQPDPILIDAVQCVFAVDGPDAALFQLFAERRPGELAASMQLSGEGTIVPANLVVARWHDPGRRSLVALEPGEVRVEGLFAARFQFAGPIGPAARDSVIGIDSYQGPSRSSEPAGINVDQLTASGGSGSSQPSAGVELPGLR